MSKNLLISLFVFLLSSTTFAQNKSVYTDLAADKCKTVDANKGMPGNYTGKCEGVGGFALEVYLDDERNSIGVVLLLKKPSVWISGIISATFPRSAKKQNGG